MPWPQDQVRTRQSAGSAFSFWILKRALVHLCFDVMVLKPVSIPEFIRVFPTVYSGKHVNHPQVSVYRSRRVRIEADTVAYADGERIGQLPISAECVMGALSTWIP